MGLVLALVGVMGALFCEYLCDESYVQVSLWLIFSMKSVDALVGQEPRT